MAKSSNAKAVKKLSGAVLSLVLIVMYVLLIMLMATLAVVSTAQNRSYSKYEENQAYYTARSALDVFADFIVLDSTYAAYPTSGSKRTITVTDENGVTHTPAMSQGLSMQMDLNSIRAHAETMTDYYNIPAANRATTFVASEQANPSSMPYPGDPTKTYQDVYSFGVAPVQDSITYEVVLPDMETDAQLKQYGKYIEKSTTTATIEVQVLARKFDENGNHNKDKTYIQATATIPYINTTAVVSEILQVGNPTPPEFFNNGVTSFGATQNLDNTSIIGGISSMNNVTMGNMGLIVGKVYCGNSFALANGGSDVLLGKSENMYIGQDFNGDNALRFRTIGITDADAMANPGESPVIYAHGDITCGGGGLNWCGGSSGTAKDRITLIGNHMTATSNDWYFNSDVILRGDLTIDGATSFGVNGNVIVQGNMILRSGANIATLPGNYFVKGNVIVEADNFEDETKLQNIYSEHPIQFRNALDQTAYYTHTCTFNYNFDNIDKDHAPYDTEDGYSMLLPEVTGLSMIQPSPSTTYIPAYDSAYCDYFTVESTGTNDYVTPYEVMSANIAYRVPLEDRAVGKYESPDPINKPLHFDLSSMSISYDTLPLSGNVNVASSGIYYLPDGNLNLYLIGSGSIDVYLKPNGWYSGKIRSSDDLTVNFLAPQGTYTWNVANYNDEVYSALSSGIRVGDDPNALSCPKIYFWVDGNSTWNMTQTGWCLLTGYFYGPSTQLNASKGLDGGPYSYFYNNDQVTLAGNNGVQTPLSANPFCIGAMVVGGLQGLTNNAVVVFIEPEETFEINIVNSVMTPIYETVEEYEHRART